MRSLFILALFTSFSLVAEARVTGRYQDITIDITVDADQLIRIPTLNIVKVINPVFNLSDTTLFGTNSAIPDFSTSQLVNGNIFLSNNTMSTYSTAYIICHAFGLSDPFKVENSQIISTNLLLLNTYEHSYSFRSEIDDIYRTLVCKE